MRSTKGLCSSSPDPVLTFSSMSVLVTSTSSAKPTSLSRLIPRPSLSKTFQVNRQPSSATVSRNWSSKVSRICGGEEHGEASSWASDGQVELAAAQASVYATFNTSTLNTSLLLWAVCPLPGEPGRSILVQHISLLEYEGVSVALAVLMV